jgi:hypothetical protein
MTARVCEDDRVKLLHGPYHPPRLRKGARAFCLYRDAEAVVTASSTVSPA